jgi:hypothetical protein
MLEIDLDAEDLACLGMRLADKESWLPRLSLLEAFGPAPKSKRARRATIKQIEKESGRVVTIVTDSPDGSRSYVLGEKVDAPAIKIDTPEQLRRLI